MREACAPVNGDLAILGYSPLAGGALTGGGDDDDDDDNDYDDGDDDG